MTSQAERLEADGAIDPILFYGPRNEWGEFSNFAPFGIWLPCPFTRVSTYYSTGEHRYQAMKSKTIEGHDYVNESATPAQAQSRGREVDLRTCWGGNYGDLCWYVMIELLLAKAAQNPKVDLALITSEDRHIYEDSPVDDIWGWRYRNDYRGKNLLGYAWMWIRGVR